VPTVGLGQPEAQAEQRCLPGSVRSDQAMHLALRHVEVNAVEGNDVAEGLADSARSDGERSPHSIVRSCLRPFDLVSDMLHFTKSVTARRMSSAGPSPRFAVYP